MYFYVIIILLLLLLLLLYVDTKIAVLFGMECDLSFAQIAAFNRTINDLILPGFYRAMH